MISKGRAAEMIVAGYLRRHGFIIAKMNYHSRYGEIDIIAESRKYLMFIEVKLRKEGAIVSPAEAVDAHKQRRIILTAKDFISKTHLEQLQPRFDVADVIYKELPNGKTKFDIHYIKNAFEV